MKTKTSHKGLTRFEKESLIAEFPLFFLLNHQDVRDLAELFSVMDIKAGTTLIHEGDIVNYIFLIASGSAEVTRVISNVEKAQAIHIATLMAGDAIGLSETGFFSQSGIRTASVTATSDMTLLAMDIDTFKNFLQQPGIIYPGLKNISEKIWLMNFLQNLHLFNHLPKTKIQRIAHKVKKLKVPKNTQIFAQNEIANKCYFLMKGKISITTTDKKGEHILKILEAPNLFGEGAFLDNAKRNASVRVEEDAELFELDHQIINLVEEDKKLIASINLKRIKQIRPIPRMDVMATETMLNEAEENVLLTNTTLQMQLQISHQDFLLWKEIDGKKTLLEISNKKEFKHISLQKLYLDFLNMEKAGLLQLSDVNIPHERTSFLEKLLHKVRFKKTKKEKL